MSLEQKIGSDYIEAMKARDTIKSSTLNFLRAQLKNLVIEKRIDKLDDVDVIRVIKKQVKQRLDSIEQYKNGNRQDLVDKEAKEMEILKVYLPEELPQETIKEYIKETIEEVQASSVKDMGKVMKAIALKIAGRADNKIVSVLVKDALSSI